MFSFILDKRFQNRQELVQEIVAAAPGLFEDKFKQSSGFGSMALFGLALSLVWSGLCLFDLCIKKHYRFERRICMFLDMVVAMVLLITGFLNFAYDALLYFDLDLAPRSQVIMEVTAVAFLGLSCFFHLGFFCHGCKDSGSDSTTTDPTEFDHYALEAASPAYALRGYSNARLLHPDGSQLVNEDGLVDIDLGQKTHILTLQHTQFNDGTIGVPVVQLEQSGDPRRAGLVGAPGGGLPRSGLLSTAKPGEGSPFLQQHGQEWI
ncbi:hypothetical protein ANO11243_046190 [Dothideomycetidae sp. 11243]|nr:hypothetical protein ANO11243_046190 [fungal sp. No.11243]